MTVVRDSTTSTEIVDVDDTPRDKYDVLMWTGSETIWAPYDTSLTFEIASFTDTMTSPVLIGADGNEWKAADECRFSATYDNGPPVSCKVAVSGTGITPWDSLEMTNSCEGPTVSTEAIDYPSAKHVTVTFTLNAATADEDDQATTSVRFRNWIFYDEDVKASAFNEADVEGWNKALSEDNTSSFAITGVGAGEYICFAFPATMTQLDGGDDYETDGASDFRYDGLTIAMLDAHETVSITNDAGYMENYDVWASTIANLGNHTLQTYSSNYNINYIKWGVVSDTVGMDETDIHALGTDSTISNSEVRTFSVTAGAGEYIAYAWPKRTDGAPSTLTFWVGGFEGGFQGAKTISVTNRNGYTEDYYLAQSSNANLGATSVETIQP